MIGLSYADFISHHYVACGTTSCNCGTIKTNYCRLPSYIHLLAFSSTLRSHYIRTLPLVSCIHLQTFGLQPLYPLHNIDSLRAIKIELSPYSNFRGKPARCPVIIISVTVTNSRGLKTDR